MGVRDLARADRSRPLPVGDRRRGRGRALWSIMARATFGPTPSSLAGIGNLSADQPQRGGRSRRSNRVHSAARRRCAGPRAGEHRRSHAHAELLSTDHRRQRCRRHRVDRPRWSPAMRRSSLSFSGSTDPDVLFVQRCDPAVAGRLNVNPTPQPVGRREFIRLGGMAISVGAVVAACGTDQGVTAPGRLGLADEGEELPGRRGQRHRPDADGPIPRVHRARRLRRRARPPARSSDEATDLIGRFVEDHTRHANLVGTVIDDLGGEQFTCGNPFLAERAITPILAALDGHRRPRPRPRRTSPTRSRRSPVRRTRP